jgi:very-short-patch-repair endonuclease
MNHPLTSPYEDLLVTQLYHAHLPTPTREHRFAPPRRWRFDFAWPEPRIAVEVEGGTWIPGGGRHNRGKGYLADLEKYAQAALLGWTVLRVAPEHIDSGQALNWIRSALEQRREEERAA